MPVIGEPLKARTALKLDLERRGVYINPFSGLQIKDDGHGLGQDFTGQRIDAGKNFRSELARRHILKAGETAGISRVEAIGNKFCGIWRPKDRWPLFDILRLLLHHLAQQTEDVKQRPAVFWSP